MTMKAAALSLASLVVAGTLGTTASFAAKPSACRTSHACFLVHSASSSAASVWRWASRGRHRLYEVIPPPPALDDSPLCVGFRSRDRADACAPHPALKIREGSIEPQPLLGKTVITKAMKAFGLALAWYLASSVAALAVSGATGLPYQPRPRRRMPIAPTLFLLYIISDKKIKTRNRFAGVVPEDDQSRRRLADDAYDMAISWGKPAGRIALLAVDVSSFVVIFRFSGYDFSKLLVGRGMEQLRSLEFWIPYGAAATLGAAGVTTIIRRFGHGYLRSTIATLLAPIVHTVIIKPSKTVASLFGAGGDWDLGISDEERAVRRASSRRLRESLSTFQDVNFAEGDHDDGSGSGAPPLGPGSNDGGNESEEGGDEDGGAPPSLKRTV